MKIVLRGFFQILLGFKLSVEFQVKFQYYNDFRTGFDNPYINRGIYYINRGIYYINRGMQ